MVKDGNFEIRQYSSYVIAETTIKGDFDNASGDAFRILAGYIFGKNKGENKIAMTSPVEMEQSATKIAMT
ncbi:MAG: heme-binding protein, partial [Pseudomonadales bacterium]